MSEEVKVEYERLQDELTPDEIDTYDKMGAIVLNEVFDVVEDKGCRNLINAFMDQYKYDFLRMVGSSSHHHNYIGGLKDHTLEVFRIAVDIAKAHNEYYCSSVAVTKDPINMDVLGTGAFLHDIGKLWSYKDSEPLKRPKGGRPKKAFKRTEHTFMMNHFGEALWVLSDLITPEMGLSKDFERQIYHIIATHHGEVRSSWGDSSSMLNPNTNEAWIVHLADMYSAKVI